MRYFKYIYMFLFSLTSNVSAIDIHLMPNGNDKFGTFYYVLKAQSDKKEKNVDIALEGNANKMSIEDNVILNCKWGDATGVRIRMDSSSEDGGLFIDDVLFFNESLDVIFAKSYMKMNNSTWVAPLSLKYNVCQQRGNEIKKDPQTQKDYITDNEMISQGPFELKGIKDVSIKYVINNGIDFIREDFVSEKIIDTYKNKGDISPKIETVFLLI